MNEVLEKIQKIGIVPVVVLDDAKDAAPLAKALCEGGLPCAEVTFRTAAAEESIRIMAKEFPEMLVGAGTVLTTEQVDRAVNAGAKFIVSPGLNPTVVKYCVDKGIPVTPGTSNPSDVEMAISLGLDVVKFFPAEQAGGINMIKAMAAPYTQMKFMPTGGINAKNINSYLAFDKILACGGSWMVKKDLVAAGEFDKIRDLTKEAVQTMLGFELAHIGINCDSETEAEKTADAFDGLFGFTKKVGNSSVFAGTAVEAMKSKGLGSIGRDRAHIDPSVCKECGRCAQSCPYNAIAELIRPCRRACPVDAITMDPETGICQIDEKKCIQCGACVRSCPFGAISSKVYVVQVIEAIKAGKKVVAMVAPAAEGEFGQDITMESWRTALKKVGFADMVEVAAGADMTAAYEAMEWAEAFKEGKKMTTSCCPAFVNMIKKHYPTLIDNMSTTVSPMCAVSRMLKAIDPETVTVFIGPCMAKKSEAADKSIENNADYVLTFGEAIEMLRGKEVELEPAEETKQEGSVFGKRFGNGGGVTNAVIECFKEKGESADVKVARCSGAAEVKKALLLLKVGRLPEDFIEGMMCQGGCVGGPSNMKQEMAFKKDRDAVIAKADDRGVWENLKNYDMDSFSMHRSYEKPEA